MDVRIGPDLALGSIIGLNRVVVGVDSIESIDLMEPKVQWNAHQKLGRKILKPTQGLIFLFGPDQVEKRSTAPALLFTRTVIPYYVIES